MLQHWLVRIHDAATHSNYEGTLVYSSAGSVTSSRVVHYFEGHGELERIDALDGEARGQLRINDEVRTIWPRMHVVVVEPLDPRASFPALVSGSESHIHDYYELEDQARDRIAGHDADRLLLKARDDERFDHLIWTDRATGLLLRSDVQVNGHTLESSAFSEVRIGVHPDTALIEGALQQSAGYRVLRPAMRPTQLEAEGWAIQPLSMPAGFTTLGCVRRALPLAGNPGRSVLQVTFTDGITHVSLFIEPYQPSLHAIAGLTVLGATHSLTRRVDDTWLTAIGDVPPVTLDRIMHSLVRRP